VALPGDEEDMGIEFDRGGEGDEKEENQSDGEDEDFDIDNI
jgi:hypothetical protein